MKRENKLGYGLARLFLVVVCVMVLTGCTPLSAGFIEAQDGVYVLTIPQKCERKIVNVSVAYYSDGSEPNPDLWAASAELDAASNRVVLFQPNDGYTTEGDVGGIDFSRELTIGWGEGEDDSPGGVTGILAGLEPGKVLWASGITSTEKYEQDTSQAIPGTHRCVIKTG
ncbi:MAG: hypothetical protein LBU38_08195 [Propionibacteriaceae bacterium]|nr:hypothetical protein [Propionibacteriaceae bacterium]